MKTKFCSSDFFKLINQFEKKLNYMQLMGIDSLFCSNKSFDTLNSWSYKNFIDKKKDKSKKLLELNLELENCKRCSLAKKRTNLVFGEGNENADLLFIGEGPGQEEDLTGKPFVGRAGKLLTRIINAMGFSKKEVYICNIVKCRPPGNRNPNSIEIKKCLPYLIKQIDIISPKIICLLGAVALNSLLDSTVSISRVRGSFIKIEKIKAIKIMPTYHPAYLLRNPKAKKYVWEDMKKIIKNLK